ncbi:MAG: hypothetical protein ABI625_03955 [bacterium]
MKKDAATMAYGHRLSNAEGANARFLGAGERRSWLQGTGRALTIRS